MSKLDSYFLKFTDKKDNTAYFYDLNTKLDHKINDKNSLSFTGYFGRDIFKFNDAFDNAYGNILANLQWKSKFSENVNSTMSAIYTDYVYGLNLGFVGFDWKSGITNYAYKWDIAQTINQEVEIKYGLNSTYYNFNPGVIEPDSPESSINYYKIPNKYAFENAFYAELEHKILTDIHHAGSFRVHWPLLWLYLPNFLFIEFTYLILGQAAALATGRDIVFDALFIEQKIRVWFRRCRGHFLIGTDF